ncbi:MAG TPA: beta-ketoacyl-[acyl-carrier-protein] synthase family protein [Prosthecobacter sp.]|nr:beta-ketoacyl-[acyl-carrier-protein] synthase family protein [Prosthecobacter sp.]
MPTEPSQRIYITGAGLVSPLGLDWRQNEAALAKDRMAFRPVTLFDVSQRIAKTAASVDLPEESLFAKVPRRRQHLIDRSTKMLLLAIREALAMAKLPGLAGIDAIVMGTSAGAMMIGQDYFRHAIGSSSRQRGQLSRLEYYQPQRQLRAIAEEYEWRGPMLVVSNACASGANAIGDAMAMIRSGRAKRVLAGGYDALAELVYSGFDTLRALAPSGVPRPFDAARDGLALGEGAGVVILESEAAVAERGAEILCEAAGYCTATDLHHLTQPDPEGKAAARTMAGACAMAGLEPSQIGYINSHGTGTPYNDVAEAAAIKVWAGESVSKIGVSSTKSAMGHLLGGAGAVEAVICVMALRGQWMPGSLNIREVDPAVEFDLVRTFRRAPLQAVVTNSFGFGGTNASLVFAEPGLARAKAYRAKTNGADVVIRGAGAVSSAGWGCAALTAAVTTTRTLTASEPERPAGTRDWPCPILTVPAAAADQLPKFARLRRASPITKFAMGAALEALADAGFPGGAGVGRLGILQCMFNGCVQFSGKFYREVLETPTLASPLIFPETVYNAPASHVAAFLGADGPVTTLVGEANIIMEALAMARSWLQEGLVDHCLVIGAEECDWLGAEATTYYHRQLRASEGAGALFVSLEGEGLRLHATAPRHYHERAGQAAALQELASTFPHVTTLIDQVAGIALLDAPEQAAWQGINGAERFHPRQVLGESMGGSAALQLALAVSLVRQRGQPVHVSLPGGIGAAYGAVVSP